MRDLLVSADGVGVVAHAGSIATRMVADRTGLTGEFSKAMARRNFTPGHDRGRVLADVAVMLADGGEAIADIDVLRHQASVLGPVASPPTVWRTLDEVTPARAKKIATARARTRRHVWAHLPDGVPASRVADTDLGQTIVLDVDATLVVTHSEKENTVPTYKGTYGYHPIGVWCDNTQEFLAATLRAGNAGSNTTTDHIEVLTHALRDAITLVPNEVWTPALDADGGIRDGGDVAELTGLIDPAVLSRWPTGMRVIVRRERPHPGAQLPLFEESDGWRYQAFVTNTTTGQLAFLEARHRAHARVEDRIRHAKTTGLRRFPSREFQINSAWL
ncbi:transposase, partial [Micrococcales bacterium 31B]|nr:transposase [Micrococcales bacterium 31B]